MATTTIAVANLSTTESYFDKFEIECHSDTSGNNKLSSQTSTGTLNSDTKVYQQTSPAYFRNLTVGTTYYFRVRVLSSMSSTPSTWSAWQSEVAGDSTPPTAQYAPSIKPIHAGAIVTLNATSSDLDVARYDVYQTTTAGTPAASVAVTASGRNGVYTLAQITSGATHYVWARAVDTSGNQQAWVSAGNYTPLADSQVITSQGQAASIINQGALATRSVVRAGTHIKSSAGVILSDVDVITSQGTALDVQKVNGVAAATVSQGAANGTQALSDAAKAQSAADSASTAVASLATEAMQKADFLDANGKIPADSKVSPGSITTPLLAANSVLAKNLVVANFDNLIPNPNSEQAAPEGGWPSGAYEATGLHSLSGYGNCRRVVQGSGELILAPPIPVKAGDRFLVQFDCMGDATNAGAFCLAEENAGGQQTGWPEMGRPTGTSWRTVTNTYTVQSGVVFLQPYLIDYNVSSGQNAYFDNFYMRRMADANLIVDGGVTARNLAVGSVTAEKISFTAGDVKYGNGATIESLKPAQAGADVTAGKSITVLSDRTADNISESGSRKWAAESGATVGATLSSNLKSSGGIVLSDAAVITSQGIAAGFTGQGELAKKSIITSTELDAGCVTTPKLNANAIQTSNYTENASGICTAGAKMQVGATALKAAAGSVQFGPYSFTDYFWRLLQGVDGVTTSSILWRGNNDASTRGGAPNIDDWAIMATNRFGTSNLYVNEYMLTGTPGSVSNLDSMMRAEIEAWINFGGAQLYDSQCIPLTGRGYYSSTSSAQENCISSTFRFFSTAGVGGVTSFTNPLQIRCRVLNQYGPSSWAWFSAPSSLNVAMTKSSTSPISGAPDGGGGGGGGSAGGGCPAPWVPIKLESGLLIDAADLYDNARVIGVDDMTFEPRVGVVEHLQTIWAQRYGIDFEDGRYYEFSRGHRFAVENRGWVAIQDLKVGDLIIAERESQVKTVINKGLGQVVSFQVKGCATYFSGDLLSHNMKDPNADIPYYEP